jgi:SAM-dependent methyltransferase
MQIPLNVQYTPDAPMHQSSYDHMKSLVKNYLTGQDRPVRKVLDIGSTDINGSYKTLFDLESVEYTGLDLAAGNNVDVVCENPYQYPFADENFDLVISGQAFEHIEFFWLTMLEMGRILKRGGLIFLIAPSRGIEHRFPVDCWRFYPDACRALARWADLDLLHASTDWEPHPSRDSAQWGDTVGVFRKTRKTPTAMERMASFNS